MGRRLRDDLSSKNKHLLSTSTFTLSLPAATQMFIESQAHPGIVSETFKCGFLRSNKTEVHVAASQGGAEGWGVGGGESISSPLTNVVVVRFDVKLLVDPVLLHLKDLLAAGILPTKRSSQNHLQLFHFDQIHVTKTEGGEAWGG